MEQPDLPTSSEEHFRLRVREAVLELLASPAQPAAWELLEFVEHQLGFKVRWVIGEILSALTTDQKLTSLDRSYVSSLLQTGDLYKALEHKEPPRKQVESSIDALLRSSAAYRSSRKFQAMIRFMARFRQYSPYNNMLVRIQNPSCSFFAREKIWYERFRRTLKDDARPMLILAPMHPVMLVYDLDQTEGRHCLKNL